MFYEYTIIISVMLPVFIIYSYKKYKDSFHPAIYLMTLMFFLYVVTPVLLEADSPDKLRYYLQDSALARAQLLAIIAAASLFAGIMIGGRRSKRVRARGGFPVPELDERRLYVLGIILGVIAVAAWLYGVADAGGIGVAYGRQYGGGGGGGSGYIYEAQFLSIPAILLIFLARRGKRLTLRDWGLVLVLVSPVLVHGLLGARRGPTFLVIVALAAGWYLSRGRRPALSVMLAAGVTIGFFLLFLLANRTEIYIGSAFDLQGSPLDRIAVSGSNEFIYGGAAIQYADHYNTHFWGRRLLITFLARPIPRQLWPDQYADMADFLGLEADLTVNYGVNILGIAQLMGWFSGRGAATGMVADLWLEFGFLMPLAAFAIGWFYGRVWRLSLGRGMWGLFYVVMMALSIHLVMQSTQAWGYRLAFSGAALAFCGFLARRRTSPRRAVQAAVAAQSAG